MAGYPYIVPQRGQRTDVIGMRVNGKNPALSGFDWHYLYQDGFSNQKKRNIGQTKRANRQPYRQLA